MLNDSLKMDIVNKEREIRRLNKDMQQYEQTIMSLRNELSGSKFHATQPLNVTSKKDAEVTADICCPRTRECDVEPVKECGKGEESNHQSCNHHQQHQKVNSDIYLLRQENVALHQELQVMQRVWAALDEQCRVADLRAKFKDEVIHEMRRQLRQAKTKLKELSESKATQKEREVQRSSQSYDSLTIACVQQPPRRKHRARQDMDLNNWECHGPMYESGDEMSTKCGMRTSTPNTSPRKDRLDVIEDADISIIERSPSPPLLISDPSISEVEESIVEVIPSDCDCTRPRCLAEITNRVKRRNSLVNMEIEEQSGEVPSNIPESVRACSVDSAASDATRIHTLENKLQATVQILKNKEETIRVQSQSLALAEARIAALSSKATAKMHHTQQTNLLNNRNACSGNHVDMTDVSISAQMQEERVVNTLRDNLSVIEELYRECFYETAKQEELISLLRRSYLDMRLEKKQSEQFTLRSQRNSLQRCQDIAIEVEHLKSEITNFLNNSTNNDSGMWEGESGGQEGSELSEELRGIAQQLQRLRAVLSADCICGLEEDNMKLKEKNETMEIQISELRQRICELEDALADKENMEQRYQKQINEKEQMLQETRQQLSVAEAGSREQAGACDALSAQLKQMEVLLNDKSVELFATQQQCDSQERTIRQLREEVLKSELVSRENNQIRLEVSELSEQVSQWRNQLADSRRRLHVLEEELQRAREHCTHLALHYREKSATAHELQGQLAEAQRRGAVLCGEARRAVCAVRRWLRAQRDKHKKQEEKIKEQERIIQTLQTPQTTEQSENEPCCSRYLNLTPRVSETTYTREHRSNTSSKYQTRESSRVRAREMPCSNCSRASETDSPPPPIPPKRLLRKKDSCEDRRCQCPVTREASVQRPLRTDAQIDTRARSAASLSDVLSREVSPPEELLERVERAHEALLEAQRRWSRHSTLGDPRHT